jgi:hypothetical protein
VNRQTVPRDSKLRAWQLALVLTLSAVLYAPARSADASGSPGDQRANKLQGSAMNTVQPLEEFLKLRDEVFETRRHALFADAGFVSALDAQQRSNDAPTAFAARVLRRWAVDKPATFADVEKFLSVDEPALRASNKTAAGGGGSTAMLRFVGQHQDSRGVLDYMLLRAWTRPSAQSEVVLGALMRYFAQKPTHEPQVWLRIALEHSDPQVLQAIAEQSMPLVDHSAALAALNAERGRLLQEKRAFPQSAESLRVRLMRGK